MSFPDFGISQDLTRVTDLCASRSVKLPPITLPGGRVTNLIPRGFPGALAFETGSKLVHYSDGDGWYSLQTGGVGDIIWQPLGTKTGIIGTTWAEVMEIAETFPISKRVIVVDPTLWIEAGQTPAEVFTIPAGTYDLRNTSLNACTTWTAAPIPGTGIPVIVEDGVKLNGLHQIDGPIAIEYRGVGAGVVPPVATETGACVDIDVDVTSPDFSGIAFTLTRGAAVECTGSAPFVQFHDSGSGGSSGLVSLETGAILVTGSNPAIDILDSPSGTGVIVGLVAFDSITVVSPDSLSTTGVAGTPVVTVGGFKMITENMTSFGGLPYVQGTYFPSVETGKAIILRSDATEKTTQSGGPGATNDMDEAFIEGDIWIDSTGPAAHICLDNASGAAVWSGAIV